MGEWNRCKLGEILTLKRGYDLPKRLRMNGSIPIFSSSGISGFHNEAKVEGAGVITGRYGTIGKVFLSQQAFWPLNTTLYVKDFKGNDEIFIYYFLQKIDWERFNDKSAVPGINRNDVHKESVVIPPLPEQKAIASVLSSLDDKIDLLHRQNKTLEAMAEALFRQWFVEEAGDDWEDGCLMDIADINPKYPLKKGTLSTYVEMKSLSTTTFSPEDWYKREFTSGMRFKNGDTLLARITPCLENGKTAFITILEEDEIGWGSTEYIVIRMKEGYHPFISYLIAKDKEFREFAIGSMSGSSGRQRADAGVLKEFDFKIPPQEVISNLNEQLSGITEKLKINAAQIRTLEQLRNTLLPKLMTGEVKVQHV